jgi:hypothetical protein
MNHTEICLYDIEPISSSKLKLVSFADFTKILNKMGSITFNQLKSLKPTCRARSE